MSNFNLFQHQKRGQSATPTPSFARPNRSFTPVSSSATESLPHNVPANPEQAARFGYSFANIAIFPSTKAETFTQSIQRQAEEEYEGSSTSTLQKTEEEEEEATVQRVVSAPISTAEEQLGSRLQAARSGGHPLDQDTQHNLEQKLGQDLSRIRVHTDAVADHLSRSINAVAFTTGPNIFFRSGLYNPRSSQGLHLLAHEASHVVQQAAGPVAGTPITNRLSISDPSDRFERAAEESADQTTANAAHQHRVAAQKNNLGDLLNLRTVTSGSAPYSIQRVRGKLTGKKKTQKLFPLAAAPLGIIPMSGANAANAIPITLYKVDSIYKPITLTINGTPTTISPTASHYVPVPPNRVGQFGTAATRTTTTGTTEVEIGGVTLPKVHVGTTPQRVKNPTRSREYVFKDVLIHNGWNWTNFAPDHILDLAVGGPDEFSNLWPLDSSTNSRAGNKIPSQPIYQTIGTTHYRKRKLSEVTTGKYLFIKQLLAP